MTQNTYKLFNAIVKDSSKSIVSLSANKNVNFL
ncbi:MAG: hypothetical protein CM15mP76_13600 [Prochlorococcus sp.]|nr:MAG: hypothetical protein CM15mP76_13600 [Prochlorococcus sp.]